MSGLVLVTGPASEPVFLSEVKAHCRDVPTEEDGLLAGYLLAARSHVEDFVGRALINRTYDLRLDWGWPLDRSYRNAITLPMPPAVSVTSVSYVDAAGATQTLDPAEYQLAEHLEIGRIREAYGKSWPAVRCQPDAVTVRYVAGYGTAPSSIPEPIRQAMLLIVGHWYANREAVVVGSSASELPMAVQSLLSPYRISV